MKVFFTASTSNLEEDRPRHEYITEIIKAGGNLNTNYIHYPHDSEDYLKGLNLYEQSRRDVFDYVRSLILDSDVVIADITRPSIRVGFQLEYALSSKIPCLVIYKKDKNYVLPLDLETERGGVNY